MAMVPESPRAKSREIEDTTMTEMTDVVADAVTFFTVVTGLGVVVIGWVKGRKLFNKGV